MTISLFGTATVHSLYGNVSECVLSECAAQIRLSLRPGNCRRGVISRAFTHPHRSALCLLTPPRYALSCSGCRSAGMQVLGPSLCLHKRLSCHFLARWAKRNRSPQLFVNRFMEHPAVERRLTTKANETFGKRVTGVYADRETWRGHQKKAKNVDRAPLLEPPG